MSDKNLARRTTAEVVFDGTNISASIRPYLLSLTYTDNEEDETDDLQIKLQDRDDIWLKQWLKDVIDAAASATTVATSTTEQKPSTYRVTPSIGLNVRTGPSIGYSKLGALICGTTITVSEIQDGWAKITYGGKTAYVCADYIVPVDTSSSGSLAVGNVVQFIGSRHYVSSTGDRGYAARPGPAKITLHNPGSKHPWHLIHTDNTSNVYGWVDEVDIQGASDASDKNEEKTVVASGFPIQAVVVRQNWHGDGKDQALDCGQFELDSVVASGPPNTITIKATSLPFSTKIRQTKKTKAWESYTLSGIAREMAKSNGMTVMYEAANDPYFARVEQYKTSDISFLSQLCHDAGISLKATNNILVLFDQSAYESKAALFTVKRGDGTYTKHSLSIGKADMEYSSCRVRYTNPSSGRMIEGTAYVDDYNAESKTNQQLEVTAKVSSVAEAQALAAKRLRLYNKYARTATFTFPGDPSKVAGITAMLEGWGTFDGKYIVKKAKHTLSSSGYTTQVELRRVLEGY